MGWGFFSKAISLGSLSQQSPKSFLRYTQKDTYFLFALILIVAALLLDKLFLGFCFIKKISVLIVFSDLNWEKYFTVYINLNLSYLQIKFMLKKRKIHKKTCSMYFCIIACFQSFYPIPYSPTGWTNWPINDVHVSNLNWRQFYPCHNIQVYFKSIAATKIHKLKSKKRGNAVMIIHMGF